MSTESGSTSSIAEQVDDFNIRFNDQIGATLAAVFAGEQSDLDDEGTPQGVIAEGDTLPNAHLVTPDGTPTTLFGVIGRRSAVLVFYRGTWCPYCNLTLTTYQRQLMPLLRAREVALVAISPQTPDASGRTIRDNGIEFTVLSDPGNVLVRELGILTEPSRGSRGAHRELGFDVADSNADGTAQVPFPTVVVIDGNRMVRFVDVHVDYTTRTEVPEIMAAVAQL